MADFETQNGLVRSTRGPNQNWPFIAHPRDRALRQTPNTTQPRFLLDVADWPAEHAVFQTMLGDSSKPPSRRFADARAWMSGQGFYAVPTTIVDTDVRTAFTSWVRTNVSKYDTDDLQGFHS